MIVRDAGASAARPSSPSRFDSRTALGPIVHFRGLQPDPVQPEGRWRLAVVFVVPGEAEPPDLRVEGVRLTLPPRHVAAMAGHGVWRFDFSIQRDRGDKRIGYGFGDERWFVTVPGLGVTPRMACLSQGGVDDDAGLRDAGLSATARWADLMARHRAQPFHIGLQAGGQIQAGNPFAAIPALAEWAGRNLEQRRDAPLTAAMAAGLHAWYAGLYLRQWRGAERAALMASLPAVMIWSESDIATGVAAAEGPWSESQRRSPVVKAVVAAARAAFSVFQLGLGPEEARVASWGRSSVAGAAMAGVGRDHALVPGGFTQGWRAGPIGILALDGCMAEPVPPALLQDWLDRFAGCRHLVVLTGTPLALPQPGALGRLLAGRQHRGGRESLEIAATLAAAAARLGLGITVVTSAHGSAGAAHVQGVTQLLAGNMSLPPGPARSVDILERAARTGTEGTEFLVLPGTGCRFLRGRHWLALDIAGETASARWHVEGRAGTVDLPL